MRSLYFKVNKVDGKQVVSCAINHRECKPISFRDYLTIESERSPGDIGLCSSSCDFPDEYGEPTPDSQAILAFLQGGNIVHLRNNSAVQDAIKNDRDLFVSVFGVDLVKHITA